MSDKIGPMAWGSQGQVFLGEDLMHTRDYSEHTSQIIDDEVELILRAQEQRALEVLARHRGGLDAVARALLDEETIDGETVGRLVDTAYGRPVHAAGVKTVPPIFVASQHGPTGTDNVDGPPADAAAPADRTVRSCRRSLRRGRRRHPPSRRSRSSRRAPPAMPPPPTGADAGHPRAARHPSRQRVGAAAGSLATGPGAVDRQAGAVAASSAAGLALTVTLR